MARSRTAWLFLAPALAVVAVFSLYPIAYAFMLSFQHYNVMHSDWVGLDNYRRVLVDPIVHRALLNTVVYAAVVVGAGVTIALGLALLLHSRGAAWQTTFKALYYLPAQIGVVVTAVVWVYLYAPIDGLLNHLLAAMHLPQPLWLANPHTALPAIIATAVIGGHGAGVILFLAALGGIPKSYYEAARLDGTSAWRQFWRITFPLIRPTTVYVLIIGFIGSFQVFGAIYLMTQGGPAFRTDTIVYDIYDAFFKRGEVGIACAEAFLLGIVIVAVSLLQYRALASDVEY
jgi:multiple sugar transport system permease protein